MSTETQAPPIKGSPERPDRNQQPRRAGDIGFGAVGVQEEGPTVQFPAVSRGRPIARRSLLGWVARTVPALAVGAAAGTFVGSRAEQLPPAKDSRMTFVRADHLDGDEGVQDIQTFLRSGDPQRNAWRKDRSVTATLRDLSPAALYIDNNSVRSGFDAVKRLSMRSDETVPLEDQNPDNKYRLDLYYSLPQMKDFAPKGVYNGKQGVYVFSGDNSYRTVMGAAPDSAVGRDLSAKADEHIAGVHNKMITEGAVMGVLAGVGAALAGGGATLNRRNFLFGSGIAAGGAALGAFEISKLINFTTVEKNTYVNGRDALSVAKTADGMDILRSRGLVAPQATSGIIMGSLHGNEAATYMSEAGKTARDKAIYDYAKLTLDTVFTVLEKNYGTLTLDDKRDITKTVLTTFAAMTISHVSEPNISAELARDNSPQAAEKRKQAIIDGVAYISTAEESPKVKAAIQNLFPPEQNAASFGVAPLNDN